LLGGGVFLRVVCDLEFEGAVGGGLELTNAGVGVDADDGLEPDQTATVGGGEVDPEPDAAGEIEVWWAGAGGGVGAVGTLQSFGNG